MRRTLALCALVAASCAEASEPCQAVREYDALTTTLTEQFYDKTFRGIDWPARVAAFRKQIACSDGDVAIAAQVNSLISVLRASHTALYTKHDLDYWALQSVFSRSLDAFPLALSGIWPISLGQARYAAYVLDDSPAARAGVLAGDQLVSLDGGPFDALRFDAQKDATLVVSSDGKTQRTVRLRPILEGMQNAFYRASIASTREIAVGKKRVGYFHLWAGTHDRFQEALESAIARFASARVDALILDFRGGFGGSGPEYLEKLKTSESLKAVPKYVLIDDGVRSGKEWITAIVRQEKIATLVGSTTAGAFLGGQANQPFDGKYFLYVAVGAFEPEGIPPIEGKGVPPDVPVPACRVFCAGRDAQLEKAIELIRAAG